MALINWRLQAPSPSGRVWCNAYTFLSRDWLSNLAIVKWCLIVSQEVSIRLSTHVVKIMYNTEILYNYYSSDSSFMPSFKHSYIVLRSWHNKWMNDSYLIKLSLAVAFWDDLSPVTPSTYAYVARLLNNFSRHMPNCSIAGSFYSWYFTKES